MTLLDYFVLVVAGVSFIFGFARGLIRSVISFAAAIVGLVLAAFLYPYAGHVAAWFVSSPAADFIGFIGVFLLVLLAGALLSRVLVSAVRRARLGWADRVLGGAFGLVKAWLICSVIYLALTAFPIRIEAVERAEFSPVLMQGASVLAYLTSKSVKTRFWNGYGSVTEAQHRPSERRR